MAERDGEVEFLWGSMADNSSGVSEEKSTVVNKLPNSSISTDNNHSEMKQPEMGSIGGSIGGDNKEVAQVAVDVGGKLKRRTHRNQKESSDHVSHLCTERERRKKTRNMFHELHALLPRLPPKADMCTIVDEARSYIKTLQQTLQKLEMKKLERLQGLSTNTRVTSLVHPQKHTRESFLANHGYSTNHSDNISRPNLGPLSIPRSSPPFFQTWTSSNVTLNVCGLDAQFSICTSQKPRLLTAICFVLEKRGLDIVSAQVSSDQSKSMLMIHARVNAPHEFVTAFPYEEIYKLAALEIMLWVNSISS